ncbi:methyl-accepting chemotaxis protein [Natrinema halophilum]|nr:methyl-accepting chemotaxis protein [Natrinema halophilum]QLG48151.2 methyl-accepting chemotaxis protein [Natrinema halophilum]
MVPTSIRERYALKFGIVLLALGVIVGSLGLVATAALTNSVESTVLDDQEDAAVREAQALDKWHQRNAQIVASSSGAPVFNSSDEAEIETYIRDTYQELPDSKMNAMYVDTASGEIIRGVNTDAASLQALQYPNASDLHDDVSYFDVQRTDPYAMPDETGIAFDVRPVVSYYIGVGDENDDRALVITFNLATRSTDVLSSTDSDTVVTIVDEKGRIVGDDAYLGYEDGKEAVTFFESYEDRSGLLKKARMDAPDATRINTRPSETLRQKPYTFAPDGYVVGYHETADGSIVLVHTTESEALGFVNTVNRFGTAVTIGAVLLIGLFGAWLGRNTAISIDRLTKAVGEMERGNLDVEVETARIDNIGRLYDGFASMRDELKRKITEAEAARSEAERERERVQEINDALQQAAAAYGDVMGKAADGDLTVRMDPETSDNDTMQAIAADFNEMLGELEGTVERINRFATDVATASEEVTASSEEVKTASEQVSESIQEISNGADDQYESLRSVDVEMNNLSTTTEEIAATSNDVADVAERTARTSREGHDAAQKAIDACRNLETERDAVVEEFEQLRTEVRQIDDLTERIAEIAEQTNMLALNANIEASRSAPAEDDGGFAAVAAEVKDLSQDVKDTTEEIGGRLDRIQNQTERSAEEVSHTSREIERVHDLVTNTVSSLEEISEYAQETNNGIQSISTATKEQAESTQEVVAMVDEVATIAEETTAEAETVAASAEEQTSALTAVSESAGNLSQQAVTLSEALARFETDTDAETAVAESLTAATESGFGEGVAQSDHDDESDETDIGGDAFSFGE